MTAHELKIWPPYFEHILDGRKCFEVRRNDRGFRVGDEIKLREWVPKAHGYLEEYFTGRNLWVRVTYILDPRPDHDPDCGLVPGYVVLGIELRDREAKAAAA
jgi:uncharacterized protein DUF3850